MQRLIKKIKKFLKKQFGLILTILLTIVTIVVSLINIGHLYTIILGTSILLFSGLIYLVKKHSKNKKGRRRIRNYMLIFVFSLGIIGIVMASLFMFHIIRNAPDFKPENLYMKESTIIYDNQDNIIAKLGVEKREIVTYNDLPQVLIDAIIATEDSRYYQHNGFDLPRFMKAAFGQARGNRDAGGASTLSMQVVKNNFTSFEQSILRKFTDIYLAIFKLEKLYTKEQILEFYVNIPFLGSGSYGVEQASRTYFGKSVSDLNLAEASLIAGLFQAPGAFDPFVNPDRAQARRKTVLNLMQRHGYITEEQEKIAGSIPIQDLLVANPNRNVKFQGYIDTVVEEVISKTGFNPYNVPMKIHTNMDSEKQTHIDKIMSGENFKFINDVVQTGIAIVGVNDGKILAIGANRNIAGERKFNFATMINRQPGSTAKPMFDYAPGMEHNNWSTYTPFLDEAYTYSDGQPINNWDRRYMGLMTLRDALDLSRNIPALKAFKSVDNRKIIEFTQKLGLNPEIDGRRIHEAHSIGGYNGSSPLEMAGAYAAFGNGGYFIEPYSVYKIEYRATDNIQHFPSKKERAMSDSTAYMITDILYQSVESGFNRRFRIPGVSIAAKTGTTNFDAQAKKAFNLPDNATNDSWVVGYSPDYVISFWYGYERISNKYYNTVNIASTQRIALFRTIANGIFKKDNSKFTTPTSIVEVQVEEGSIPAMLPSEFTPSDMITTEYFRKGTEPTEISPRFNRITTNVSNLNGSYDTTANRYTITWNRVNTPIHLTEQYFINNYSSTFGEHINKYWTQYKNFNDNFLGLFGYNIYSKDTTTGELNFITFTENNSFSEATNQNSRTYVVKTGFSKLRDNQSNGSEITLTTGSANPAISISLNGEAVITIPIGSAYPFTSEILVLENSIDVTNQASITRTIYRLSDNAIVTQIDTSRAETYQINYNVTYRQASKLLYRTVIVSDYNIPY